VFPAEDGSPLDGHSVTGSCFYRLLERAGLPRIRFHERRHTYATLMRDPGADMKGVSASLGHSTTTSTADLYTHVTMHSSGTSPTWRTRSCAGLSVRLRGVLGIPESPARQGAQHVWGGLRSKLVSNDLRLCSAAPKAAKQGRT
jgi:hypothetical protein